MKSIKLHIFLIICLAVSILIFLMQLILSVYYFNSYGRNILSLILTIIAMILSVGVIILFWYMYKPMKQLHTKMERIREEMPEDEFWAEVDGPDMVGQVLENIDRLFERVKEHADRAYKAELLSRQAEFSALQSQINPHFLYNTLESIRGQALIAGVDEIADMTEALSTFFRYNIEQKGDLVTLEEEIKNVENYFLIQRFRFENRFSYSITLEDPVALTCLIPKLTIQPIVENSIVHGLEKKIGKGNIDIRATLTAKRLILDISDDGIGMDKTTLEELRRRIRQGIKPEQAKLTKSGRRTGIAMSNVNQRIQLFFGGNYGIDISSTLAMGTSVQIAIPRIYSEDRMAGEKP